MMTLWMLNLIVLCLKLNGYLLSWVHLVKALRLNPKVLNYPTAEMW